jgi:hypothetical protein
MMWTLSEWMRLSQEESPNCRRFADRVMGKMLALSGEEDEREMTTLQMKSAADLPAFLAKWPEKQQAAAMSDGRFSAPFLCTRQTCFHRSGGGMSFNSSWRSRCWIEIWRLSL